MNVPIRSHLFNENKKYKFTVMIRKRVCLSTNKVKISCLAFLVLFACACSKNENMPAPGGSGVPISFTGGKSTTRVSQITTTDNMDNMAMFAFSASDGHLNEATSTPDFMYNKEVKKLGNAWTYYPVMFWPSEPYTVSFFAISPIPSSANGISVLTSATDAGYPVFEVAPPVKASQQVDLCVTSPVLNATYADPDGDGNSTNDTDGTVPLNFKHAMAKVNFKARYTTESGKDVDLRMDMIEMKGVTGNGRLKFTQDGYQWTIPAGSSIADYKLESSNDDFVNTPILKEGAEGDDLISSTTGTLCLVPQTVPAGATIHIKTTTEGLGDLSVLLFSAPLTGTWNAGETYSYSFKINNKSAKPGSKWEFTYSGASKRFIVPVSGKYKIEIWGNQGGRTGKTEYLGGKGGYTAGEIELTARDILKIYVGQWDYSHNYVEGWNGGGKAGGYNYCSPGAGSIDVRFVNIENKLGFNVVDIATDENPFLGLTGNEDTDPRIIVGGGGGGNGSNDNSFHSFSYGGYAGGLEGVKATYNGAEDGGSGGTQTAGGLSDRGNYGYTIDLTDGSAGRGGNTGKKSNNDGSSSGGGGGGWFGGGCGSWYAKTRGSGGGGGSSHINSKLFTNPVYKAGNEEFLAPDGVTTEIGHSGAGMVRITLLEIP